MKRTQIYLDEDQDVRLARRASAAGRTKSELIREAIDRYLDHDDATAKLARFKAALKATAGTIPRLPSGAEYVETSRAVDRRRQAELENRRQS